MNYLQKKTTLPLKLIIAMLCSLSFSHAQDGFFSLDASESQAVLGLQNEVEIAQDASHAIVEAANMLSPKPTVQIKCTITNHSDWTIRFMIKYMDGSRSRWITVKANTTKSLEGIDKPTDGVKVQWLDISKWKLINGVKTRYKNNRDWHYVVKGRVFPYKAISIK